MKYFYEFISRNVCDFLKNKRGASAVEFALILPVMVTIYMSTVEISLAVAAQRRVAIASGTMGDLAAQYDTMNADSIDVVLNSSFAVLQPYDPEEMTARIASYTIDTNGVGVPDWSYKISRVNHVNSPSESDNLWWNSRGSIPADMRVPGTSVIVARLDYTYVSPIGALLSGSRELTQQVYFRPRLGSKITFQSSTPSASWTLPTSGPDGSQISTDYIGFGAEYMLQPRTIERSNAGNPSEDPPPGELSNAWACDNDPDNCNHQNPGSGGMGGGPGDGPPGGELPINIFY